MTAKAPVAVQFQEFMDTVRDGARYSPEAIRKFLEMDAGRFASLVGVHRNTLSKPDSPKLQHQLSLIVAALSALSHIHKDLDRAAFTFFCQPIGALGHQTPAGLIRDSKGSLLLEYLCSPAAAELFGPRRCRVCGCTDTQACPDGCNWAECDLCSACKGGA